MTTKTLHDESFVPFTKATLSGLAGAAFLVAASCTVEPTDDGPAGGAAAAAGQSGNGTSGGAPAGSGGASPSGGSGTSAGAGGGSPAGGQSTAGGGAGATAGMGGAAGIGGASGMGGAAGGAGGSMTGACTPARPHDRGATTVTLQSGGMNRSYILHVPPAYDGLKPLPLVFDVHGYTSFASEQVARSKWDKMADQEGFVLVAPDGVNESWNAGNCCGGNKQDDVTFFRDIVKKVTADLCVDSKRVYVTGHSNGGAMTYRLACEAADIFAAVAPVCGGMFMAVSNCNPSRPIPVMGIRSTGDTTVTIASADDDVEEWLENNQCASSPVTTDGVCKTYASCAAGTQVVDCRPPGNHGFFYANNNQFLVPDEVWPFFKQFALP